MVQSIGFSQNEGLPCLDPADDAEDHDLQGADVLASYRQDLTRGQLIRISLGMLGLMFGWAVKTVLTTPLFRDVYGVDTANLGFVWLAGPLSGLVMQPVIGVISDHREGQGQRSMFFGLGAIVMALSLAALPSAGAIVRGLDGTRAEDSGSGSSDSGHKIGTGLAVAALWLLDLAMNASLVAIRAVVADCAPPEQQPEANTAIIISYGTGTLLGYGFGALNVARWLGLPRGPFWKACIDFWMAALVLLFAAAVASREAFLLEHPRAVSPPFRHSPPLSGRNGTVPGFSDDTLDTDAHRTGASFQGEAGDHLACMGEGPAEGSDYRRGQGNGVLLSPVHADATDVDRCAGHAGERTGARSLRHGVVWSRYDGGRRYAEIREDRVGPDTIEIGAGDQELPRGGHWQESTAQVAPHEGQLRTVGPIEHAVGNSRLLHRGQRRRTHKGGSPRPLDAAGRDCSDVACAGVSMTQEVPGYPGARDGGNGEGIDRLHGHRNEGHGGRAIFSPRVSAADSASSVTLPALGGGDVDETHGGGRENGSGWCAGRGRGRRGPRAADSPASSVASAWGASTSPSKKRSSSIQTRTLEMFLFFDVPDWLRPVCALLFFCWIGWFAVFIFGSDWVGVDIFGGDPSAPEGRRHHEAYEDGVRWASVGLAAQAAVITVMGCGPVTWLVRVAGLRGSFLTMALSQAVLLLVAAYTPSGSYGKAQALGILAGLGIPLALIESLPYMMVGMFSPRHTHGQLLGKLNVWIVLAQLALTLCVRPIIKVSLDGDATVLTVGSGAAAIGLLCVPAIRAGGKVAQASSPEPARSDSEELRVSIMARRGTVPEAAGSSTSRGRSIQP